MANRRAIEPEHVPELIRRHRAGETLRALAEWLKGLGCEAAPNTIRAELARAGLRAEVPADLVIPDAEPADPDERRRVLRYEVAQERRDARVDKDADWKRYHSAIRMSLELLKLDTKPQAGEQQSEGATPGFALPTFGAMPSTDN